MATVDASTAVNSAQSEALQKAAQQALEQLDTLTGLVMTHSYYEQFIKVRESLRKALNNRRVREPHS
jgi:hypothetical protein